MLLRTKIVIEWRLAELKRQQYLKTKKPPSEGLTKGKEITIAS